MPDELTKAIATDLGITNLPQEQQEQLISRFGEIALKAASLAVLEKLAEDKRMQFLQLAEAGDPLAVQEFLNREVPDHEKIAQAAVAAEVAEFKAAQAA